MQQLETELSVKNVMLAHLGAGNDPPSSTRLRQSAAVII
jgi:uncharacterized Ntn-hydrolase superfamily protein